MCDSKKRMGLRMRAFENVTFCKIHSEFVPIVNIVFFSGSRTPKRINTNTGGQRVTGNYVLIISTNYYSKCSG